MESITPPHYDAIIVGAGFAGCHTLKTLRDKGYKTTVLEAGADIGGVWLSNRYPGARVDTKIPLYEFSNKDLWADWTWTEKYPDQKEILKYFEHVEKKLHLKKDIKFNFTVAAADFDNTTNEWCVKSKDGAAFTSRHFILCTGSFSTPYIPSFKGLNTFAGDSCHTAQWPVEGLDCTRKRVGVIGNASSGLQTIQEIAPYVKHLTVFQRSPTYALPMRQKKLTKEDQDKRTYAAMYEKRTKTFAGIDREFDPKSALSVSDEEREKFFEEAWAEGGLTFWLANYQDVIMDKDANAYAYKFWRSKVLPRIKNPKIAEILAPEVPAYYFGTKRATLEQRYYEVYNQDNVDLIHTRLNDIKEIVPQGVVTQDGVLHKLDHLILATGFNSVTGPMLDIDIKGLNGHSLKEKWSKGTWTSLGLLTSGFPNMYFLYGPQAPTTFCNGPTCAEVQGEWITKVIDFMRDNHYTRLNADVETEKAWKEQVETIGNQSLLPFTQSEYMGTNVPGKPKEMLNYLGGLKLYTEQMNGLLEGGFPGFELK